MLSRSKLVMIIGYGIAIANSVILYAIFLYACYNGGMTEVNVNSIGEMWLEITILPIALLICIVGFREAWRCCLP